MASLSRPIIYVLPESAAEMMAPLQDRVELRALSWSHFDTLANNIKDASALVLGETPPELQVLMPILRNKKPELLVVASPFDRLNTDMVFLRNYADIFDLPKDSEKLWDLIQANCSRTLPTPVAVMLRHGGQLAFPLISILLAWWLVVMIFNPATYLLPSPVKVVATFFSHSESYLGHVWVTAQEAGTGFLIGNALGIALAIVLHHNLRSQHLILPLLIGFQAVPIVAFAPLLVIWLGTGFLSKMAMATIICFFPMVVNAMQAFSSIDRDYIELFEFYRAEYTSKLLLLLIPASFPSILAALKISAGLSVVGAIVAELTGADRGLGYLLLNSTYRLETDITFVAILLSGLLGVVFYRLPSLFQYLLPAKWRKGY
jgi:NitT/TauT family transport system permease protein